MLKILYFSGSYQLFQISLGIKSLYFRVEKFIHWPGRQFETKEEMSASLSTGEANGVHLTGALGHGVCRDMICNVPVYLLKECIHFCFNLPYLYQVKRKNFWKCFENGIDMCYLNRYRHMICSVSVYLLKKKWNLYFDMTL